jgi:uncharacterized membrane protein YfcA
VPWYELLAIAAAGVAAGTINAVVGSGTLITFPTLLAFGFPPVVANVSNNIGLVPGGVTASWGYRQELTGQGRRVLLLGPMSLAGAVTGSLLLLSLPASAFRTIVPALLALSVALVLAQNRIQAAVARRRAAGTGSARGHSAIAMAGVYGAGAYGGYFGAAQGVLLVGLLGSLLPEPLQRVNALKNVLSLIVNAVSAVVFVSVARDSIDLRVVGLIAGGSLLGGFLGARFGRRLSPRALRAIIVVVGVVAIVKVLSG